MKIDPSRIKYYLSEIKTQAERFNFLQIPLLVCIPYFCGLLILKN